MAVTEVVDASAYSTTEINHVLRVRLPEFAKYQRVDVLDGFATIFG